MKYKIDEKKIEELNKDFFQKLDQERAEKELRDFILNYKPSLKQRFINFFKILIKK